METTTETVNQSSAVTQVLNGHTSEESSYTVCDYPYGFKLRCQIRYWLEYSPKKGYRFVSQTENPKTGRWNAPKKSTYSSLAGQMYRDGEGHVKWTGLGDYTGAEEALKFVRDFPGGKFEDLKVVAKLKMLYCQRFADGAAYVTINGERRPTTPTELEGYTRDAKIWAEVYNAL